MCNVLTIKEKCTYFVEIEKSKFYGIAYPIKNESEVPLILSEVKKEYPKARHYCYAYVLDTIKKYSDDGEPQGTAGKPILNQIEQNNLKYTLIVVVRYFGGTLLGSGRLLRTYLNSAKGAIECSKKQELIQMFKHRVQVSIDTYSSFLSYLNRMDFVIINTVFSDKITIDFLTPLNFKDDYDSLFYGKVEKIMKIDYLYRRDL